MKKIDSYIDDTVASKYLETLQRSNEQLVKVTSLIYKKDTTKFAGLSSEDKDEIFDLIQSGD